MQEGLSNRSVISCFTGMEYVGYTPPTIVNPQHVSHIPSPVAQDSVSTTDIIFRTDNTTTVMSTVDLSNAALIPVRRRGTSLDFSKGDISISYSILLRLRDDILAGRHPAYKAPSVPARQSPPRAQLPETVSESTTSMKTDRTGARETFPLASPRTSSQQTQQGRPRPTGSAPQAAVSSKSSQPEKGQSNGRQTQSNKNKRGPDEVHSSGPDERNQKKLRATAQAFHPPQRASRAATSRPDQSPPSASSLPHPLPTKNSLSERISVIRVKPDMPDEIRTADGQTKGSLTANSSSIRKRQTTLELETQQHSFPRSSPQMSISLSNSSSHRADHADRREQSPRLNLQRERHSPVQERREHQRHQRITSGSQPTKSASASREDLVGNGKRSAAASAPSSASGRRLQSPPGRSERQLPTSAEGVRGPSSAPLPFRGERADDRRYYDPLTKRILPAPPAPEVRSASADDEHRGISLDRDGDSTRRRGLSPARSQGPTAASSYRPPSIIDRRPNASDAYGQEEAHRRYDGELRYGDLANVRRLSPIPMSHYDTAPFQQDMRYYPPPPPPYDPPRATWAPPAYGTPEYEQWYWAMQWQQSRARTYEYPSPLCVRLPGFDDARMMQDSHEAGGGPSFRRG